MVKPDSWIRAQVREHQLIAPFAEYTRQNGVVSYGLTPYGYDMRISQDFRVSTFDSDRLVDPKRFDLKTLKQVKMDVCIIPPNGYVLARSVEMFTIPHGVIALPMGKLIYTRAGLSINMTMGEPGWKGQWLIQIANLSPAPVKVYAMEGIAQVVFFESSGLAQTTIDRRRGNHLAALVAA